MANNLGDAPFNPYIAASQMEIEHRGFKLARDPEHISLWEIKSEKPLPRELMGRYTALDLAKGRIDEHLEGNKKNGK